LKYSISTGPHIRPQKALNEFWGSRVSNPFGKLCITARLAAISGLQTFINNAFDYRSTLLSKAEIVAPLQLSYFGCITN
jgi:hypothetical protein